MSNEGRSVSRAAIAGGAPVRVAAVSDPTPAIWLEDDSLIISFARIGDRVEYGLSACRHPAATRNA